MGKITVSQVGKAYKQYPSKRHKMLEWLTFGLCKRHQLKWILQDISFSLLPGEAVGIIGINGAGKSTLLKMITGTSSPTAGNIILEGRVAALLELGMGFHPDFSGRQNAYLAGQLLGYSTDEITQLMPEIESFAEIGDYINEPVRVYSSGMQVRLAFAIATARRPDILIVDEALSVGDSYFQHKSFERIREFSKEGTTLLLVSHDKQAIQSICKRAILLNKGRVAMHGEPEAVMDYYNALLADNQNQLVRQEKREDGRIQTISGTGEVTILSAELLDSNRNPVEVIGVGELIILRVTVKAHQNTPKLVFGFSIKDRLGQTIYGSNTALSEQVIENVSAGAELEFIVKFEANVGMGSYSIQLALVSSDTHLNNNYEWRDLAVVFTVINKNKRNFAGMIWLETNVEINIK